MSSRRRGRLFIVSAPSGAGKTTLVRRLVQALSGIAISRSYTTRPIRPGEADGVDYRFVTVEQFLAMREAGAFLEWAEVFGQHFYATGVEETEQRLAAGEDLVLVIDVQGARKVRASGVPSVGIFVLPPSLQVLETRLRARGGDSEEQVRRRLATASAEVLDADRYDYVVVNDDVDSCVERMRSIVVAERSRREAMSEEVASILATFPARKPVA